MVFVAHEVKDESLAEQGQMNIEYAEQNMPALRAVRARFEKRSEEHTSELQSH